MSNKLIRNEKPDLPYANLKKKLFGYSLTILCIAFVFIWLDIVYTTAKFSNEIDKMVEGEDYYKEQVIITEKRIESGPDNDIAENYFFYHHQGKVHEYDKRIQVPGNIYSKYAVGDSIEAYTTDHLIYSYEKEGILPGSAHKNNELKKCFGVLIGCAICFMILWKYLACTPPL